MPKPLDTPGFRLFRFIKEREGQGGPDLPHVWGGMSGNSQKTWEREAESIFGDTWKKYRVTVLVHHNEEVIVRGTSADDAIVNAEMDMAEKYPDAVMIDAFSAEEEAE